jgi:hypothetical protein
MNEQRTVSFPNLKFPKQVKGGKVIFTQDEFANFAGQILNAVRFMRLIVPTTDGANNLNTTEAQIEWAEEGVIITLPPQFNIQTAISSSGGGNVVGGIGPPTAATVPAGNYTSGASPSLYVDEENNNIYYCSTAGTQATAEWTEIITAANAQAFVVQECFGSSVTALMYNFSNTFGSLVTIAKPYNLRTSVASETFSGNGVTYDYSIDDGTGNYRVATGPDGFQETQVMIPRYQPNSLDVAKNIIFAVPCNDTGVAGANWLEVKPGRMWALEYPSPP